MTLEQVFEQIAKRHDLYALSFGMNAKCSADYLYTVTAHWDGASKNGNPCEHGHGATIADAMRNALAAVEKDRGSEPAVEKDRGSEPAVDFSELLKIAA